MKNKLQYIVSFFIFVLTLTSTAPAWSQPIKCKVFRVYDGDTVTAWCAGRKVRIRLAEIDAPEKDQPFGISSRRILASMVRGRTVRVEAKSTDRYGRLIGTIHLNGENINRKMVRMGAAWVYRRYCHDAQMLKIENQARNEKRGLWGRPHPIPPWIWRHGNRKGRFWK